MVDKENVNYDQERGIQFWKENTELTLKELGQ